MARRRNPDIVGDLLVVGALGVGGFFLYRAIKPLADAATSSGGVITSIGNGAAYTWGDLTAHPVPAELCADIASFRSGAVLPIIGNVNGDPHDWEAFRRWALGKMHGAQGYDPGNSPPSCW